MPSTLSTGDSRFRRRLQTRLLSWFGRHRRDLPWRHDRDPYRIWVSEIMLQQTQVATVMPYFERFLVAFPAIEDLALARAETVLRLWEGLGYYRRAHDLHQAARQIVREHGGHFPEDPGTLERLPGIGRYTAGAVLSQAFDRRLPIVEANSRRVLCRLFGQSEDTRRGPGLRWLWQTAERLLPRRRAGDFNQALMELGALVCLPAAPRCAACPLARECVAHRRGLQEKIPAPRTPPPIVTTREVAVVVRRGARVLLAQRPRTGRWAGLWEFPHGPVEDGETGAAAAVRQLALLTDLRATAGAELLTLKHSVTRFRVTMTCIRMRYRSGRFRSDFFQQGRWLKPVELLDYPVAAPQRRLTQVLLNGGGPVRKSRDLSMRMK